MKKLIHGIAFAIAAAASSASIANEHQAKIYVIGGAGGVSGELETESRRLVGGIYTKTKSTEDVSETIYSLSVGHGSKSGSLEVGYNKISDELKSYAAGGVSHFPISSNILTALVRADVHYITLERGNDDATGWGASLGVGLQYQVTDALFVRGQYQYLAFVLEDDTAASRADIKGGLHLSTIHAGLNF